MGDTSVSMAATSVTLADGRGSLTASVTNRGTTPQRVILGIAAAPGGPQEGPADDPQIPPGHDTSGSDTGPDPRAWATVQRPFREIGPGATEQYVVEFDAPEAPTGSYALRVIARSADPAPDERSDPGRTFQIVVPPSTPTESEEESRWWLGILVVVVPVSIFAVVLLVYTLARGA